ncbi:MAG: RNA polymerase sigma factor [Rhizobacter sp.]|nr:RNA polymerase sigma factor [Chlorobiales bacterium]
MEHTPTDAELIEYIKTGDDRAFGELVARYEPLVAATVVRMLGHGDDADDAGQETFIRFYESLEAFRGDASVGTYLTRIAINLSLNRLKQRRRWFHIVPLSLAENVSDKSEHQGESKDAIERALESLKPGVKAVVVLRLMQEYTTEETAEILGVPVGTVLSRLWRAQQHLKDERDFEK